MQKNLGLTIRKVAVTSSAPISVYRWHLNVPRFLLCCSNNSILAVPAYTATV